jgi:hypothetical protein
VSSGNVRQLSKVLYGNRYRLEIAAAIGLLDTDVFHAKEVADGLGMPHNVVSQQIKCFVEVGVCEDMPAIDGHRNRYFRRLDSPYWQGCITLLEVSMTQHSQGS